MRPWRWIIISALFIGLVISATLFDMPRRALIQIASIYPISAIVNILQRYTIPSNNQQCLSDLAKLDVDFKTQSSFSKSNGCSVQYAVRLARVGNVKLDNAPLLTCSMATQLSKFEKHHLQPTAQSILGSKAKRIKHLGTYNCRSMRQFNGVLSQHAFANAIDISEFVLEDGRSISVEKDWKGKQKPSQFLKQIASSACLTFRVSISPDGDANHFNHLHWDAGLWGSCR
jgi:hypothetical protein